MAKFVMLCAGLCILGVVYVAGAGYDVAGIGPDVIRGALLVIIGGSIAAGIKR